MSDNKNNTLSFCGTVERVMFLNTDNGYIVFELTGRFPDKDGLFDDRTPPARITATGVLGNISAGEKLFITGSLTVSPKYGQQFKALTVERRLPDTPSEIAKFLVGSIKGMTLRVATAITDTFGTETLTIVESFPERLTEVKGINDEKAEHYSRLYRRENGEKVLIEYLAKYHIAPSCALDVFRKFEERSMAEIKRDPFLLCDEDIGIAFPVADTIARDLGVSDTDGKRVSAAIRYVLLCQDGHTCLPAADLREQVCMDCDISSDAFDTEFENGITANKFYVLEINGMRNTCKFAFLPEYYIAETYAASKLRQMLKINYGTSKDYTSDIDTAERENGLSYAPLQREAVSGCMANNVFVLTGGPGTGKTTTLNGVIKLLKKRGKSISLGAPTGRAAKRLSELTGTDALTIHRLLEVDVSKDNSLTTFKRCEDNPIESDVVIIDEMSMVDALLFESLLRAIKIDTRLILVGDSNQLPSVGAGNVLKELIESGEIPTTELTEIFRQAAESLIVTNAHYIIHGKMPELQSRSNDFFFMRCPTSEAGARLIASLVKDRLPRAYNVDAVSDIQILSPTKIGMCGTKELNRMLQQTLNPPARDKREIKHYDGVFRVGDKVMQNKNNYDIPWKKDGDSGLGVYNGDIGAITDIGHGETYINFDGRVAKYLPEQLHDVEHAYAVTIHKSQGSEYDVVIMPVMTDFPRRLIYRNLLYTGVTRARKILIVIGSEEAVYAMAENDVKQNRYSCLRYLIN